jgi:hypothetical protein
MPAVSMINMRKGYFSLGGSFNSVYYLTKMPTALQEALTPNNQTPYAVIPFTTKDGPIVLDIPPATSQVAIFGSLVDIWQEPMADVGPAGMDQGQGGKYLFLPPDFEGEAPAGYFSVSMRTFNGWVALRLIPLGGTSFAETAEYAKEIKAYPLTEADNPPTGNYIDQAERHNPTLPTFDMTYFEDIATLINEEPLQVRDKVMGGMLASIGIEGGKLFKPEGKTKAALEQAAKDGKKYVDHLFEKTGTFLEYYWPDRYWRALMQPSSEGFVYDEGEYLFLDARAGMFNFVTFAPRHLGKATAYMVGQEDANGAFFSGQHTYRLAVPAKVPAKQFWSIIAYSNDTKGFIYNDIDRVGLSSLDTAALQMNDDGSVDIYFGEKPPTGLDSNWIPTAGEDFFVLFRFYGPEESFFNKSFVLPDIEKID